MVNSREQSPEDDNKSVTSNSSQPNVKRESRKDHRESPTPKKSKKSKDSSKDDKKSKRSSRRSKSRESNKREKSKHSSKHSSKRSSESSDRNVQVHYSLKPIWDKLEENPKNFDLWVELITKNAENSLDNSMELIFKRFLENFPYCYGYWIQYASYINNKDGPKECLHIYQKAVKEFPICVELWMSYLQVAMEHYMMQPDGITDILKIINKALEECGMDFNSDNLWISVIDWEVGICDLKSAFKHFEMILGITTDKMELHQQRFEHFIRNYSPDLYLPDSQLDSITKRVLKKMGKSDIKDILIKINNGNETTNVLAEDAHLLYVKYILQEQEEKMKKTSKDYEGRKDFEHQIVRRYFHIAPLENKQFSLWFKYLDWEINNRDEKKIKCLFERCLVACCLYEEYWMKYARYLDKNVSKTQAKAVLTRAHKIHIPSSSKIALLLSLMEERNNNFNDAVDILDNFDLKYPGYASVRLRMVSLLNRKLHYQNRPDEMRIIEKMERLINERRTSKTLRNFYIKKLARFQAFQCNNLAKADKLLREAIKNDPENNELYAQLVDIYYCCSKTNIRHVCDAFDLAIKSTTLSDHHRLQYAKRKMEYMEEFCMEPSKIQTAWDDYNKLIEESGCTISYVNNQKQRTMPVPYKPMSFAEIQRQTSSSNQMPMMVNDSSMTLLKNDLKENSNNLFNRTYTFGADLLRKNERRNSLTADSDIFDYNIDDLVRGIKPRHPSRSASKSFTSKSRFCSTLHYPITYVSSKFKFNSANVSETLSSTEDKKRSNLPSVKGCNNNNLCSSKLFSKAKLDTNKYEESLNYKHEKKR
uniref:Pre-mRNA-processing factor 39 n=1 Tax=Parastrongyloides trichosuri TaxID=131310 RepID=A0A0N4ZZ01_PARTI